MAQRRSFMWAATSLATGVASDVFTNSSIKSKLCDGKGIVAPGADWVWSAGVLGQSPSCTDPLVQNPAQTCAGDPTSLVMEGNGQPQCLSAGTDCYFNMRDLTQLDF